ncbi:MAG TPA: DegT/DnrJ/EryC1/StrS family aminotransferase [Gaiellaceae bacterium]|nr:DegT/DnrJ/EryC1/StrS family aminotransferase [Gaiellaceae bacterium]
MSSRVPFVDLAAQQAAIAWELSEALDDVAARSDWILGQDVDLFEAEFGNYCESPYAVGVDSGLSALELTLRALDVGPGDEVITAANTFVATVFAIAHVDATPVLVDVDPKTYTLDPDGVRAAITKRTRAIVPVHLYGQPADMDSLGAIARCHGLHMVEDACQAHGARYKGQRVGSIGDAAAFSFYPAKNLGAHGDGGMVVTKHRALRDRLRVLRNYGQKRKNQHIEIGFNRRLDTLQAAILRVKLRHLDAWNKARRAVASLYDELLPEHVVKPTATSDVEAVWHLYPIQVEERDRLAEFLEQKGIGTGIHYPLPAHRQDALKSLGYAAGSQPIAEAASRRLLSLPMYPELTPASVRIVTAAVRDFFESGHRRLRRETATPIATGREAKASPGAWR